MPVIIDYPTLVQAIIDTAEDDGLEFVAYIPTAVDQAEEFMFKDLDLPDLEIKVPGVLIPGNTTVAKPAGYRYANYFKIMVPDPILIGQTNNLFLKKRRDDYLQDYWPNTALQDVPKYYSDSSVLDFDIVPPPNFAFTYEIKYTAQPAKLTLLNPTNYYTTRCTDSLFNACMVQMVRFMKAWSQVPIWEAHYKAASDAWNINMRRVRRDDGNSPKNPTNGPNDLAHTIATNS